MRGLFGAAAAALPFAGRVPLLGQSSCEAIASPSLTEGPYFVDEDLNRADIRNDPADGSTRAGVPLVLRINVSKLMNCNRVPLTGAYVDIWHCDAAGLYSNVAQQSTVGKRFLRGYLPTDRHGNVEFITVYPGWYQGRAVHIHSKIRMFDGEDQTYEFTSQFFFDETVTDDVYSSATAYQRATSRDTRNTNDGIFNGASSLGGITSNSGSHLMLNLTRKSEWVEAQGSLLCDLALGSSPDQAPGGGRGPGGGGPGGAMPPGPPPA
jgi:protocatechuate 3,4-dioxygenase beta subunit